MKKLIAGMAIIGVASGVTGGMPVIAAPQEFPWEDPNSNFVVGVSGACSTSGVRFKEQVTNSFDDGGLVTVNDTYIGSDAEEFGLTIEGSDALATYPETGTEPVGDLGVSVSYRITSDDIVRTIVTITNNGASDATDVEVNIENDFGFDFKIFFVEGGTWRPSGSWFVTADSDSSNASDYNYGPIFHLPDGPGSPESPATYALCDGTPLDPNSDWYEDSVFEYLVDVPAGATRRIIIIQGVVADENTGTVSSVSEKASVFDPAGQTPGVGIFSDLSAESACTVVNWAFEGCGGDGGLEFDPDWDYYVRRAAEEGALPNTM